MRFSNNSSSEFHEAEVIESSVVDESKLKKILIKAGRAIALPALEAFEMIADSSTPAKARVSLIAALSYLVMPVDLMPDFIPVSGFSDDLVALTAVITLWQQYMTPEMKIRARQKLEEWFPL